MTTHHEGEYLFSVFRDRGGLRAVGHSSEIVADGGGSRDLLHVSLALVSSIF